MLIIVAASASAQEIAHFDLPSQPLATSLKEVADESGINVLFDRSTVAGLQAKALKADLTPAGAIDQLLKDTGLTRELVDAHTIVITAALRKTSQLIPLVGSAASSQSSRPAPSSATDGAQTNAGTASTELQEVIVTATRRAENISKVPISITALTQPKIDALGIKDFADMVKFTPGVTFDDSSNNISIRGIASSGGANTTGIYIDDTPVQTRTTTDVLPEAFDVDRIEVLRGPQGTLFGAGAEGGAVRYITTQPSVAQSSLYSRDEISYTQGGAMSYDIGVAGGGPVIDNVLGLRASVLFTHFGGWIDRIDSESPTVNAAPSQNILESNSNRATGKLFRLAALWQPNQNWQITPGIYYSVQNALGGGSVWPIYSDPARDRFYDGTPDLASTEDHFLLSSLKIQGNLGFANFISNTSYFNRNLPTIFSVATFDLGFYQTLVGEGPGGTSWLPGFPLIDGSGIHLPPGFRFNAPTTYDSWYYNWTQELRLQSNDPVSRLQWTVGAFYALDQEQALYAQSGADDPAFFQYFAGATVPQIFNGIDLICYPTGGLRGCYDFYFLENQYTRQYAAYGDASYAFTDQWKLDVGLRESLIMYSFDEYDAGAQLFGPPQAPMGYNKQPSFTPKASLNFQADPNNLYYFAYARGFRPGGADSPIPYAACQQDFTNLGVKSLPTTYGPDTTENFEVGAKNNIAGRVQLATSVFWINWDNIQQTAVLPICGLTGIFNLGTAVSKGADFQGTFQLTDRLTLDIAAGYTDARYTKSSRLTPRAATPIVQSGDAIAGTSGLPTPPWSGTLGLEYTFKAFAHDMFVRADDQFVSAEKWIGPQMDPGTSLYDPANFLLPSTNELNLRAGVTVGVWQIEAFVNNLADAHPLINYGFSSLNTVGPSRLETTDVGLPRTMGLTFIFRK